MIESVEIKNFKRIGETPLKLNNLAKVNYLVGKNGSGKSSVIECLYFYSLTSNKLWLMRSSIRNEHSMKKVHLPTDNTILNFNDVIINWNDHKFLNHFQNIITDKLLVVYSFQNSELLLSDLEKSQLQESLELSFEELEKTQEFAFWDKKFIENSSIKSTLNKIKSKSGPFEGVISTTGDNLHTNIHLLGKDDIIYQHINKKSEKFDFDTGIWDEQMASLFDSIDTMAETLNLKWSNKGDIIKENLQNKMEQSSGQYILLQLAQLWIKIKQFKYSLVVMEEPESFLHPEYQKIIATFMNIAAKKADVKFIISTHSPFIISAAGEFPDTQKVYMIEDGKCLNPEGSSGKDVKGIAATMLGAGIEDLTPSTVVFCAQSEKEFLKRINTKWYFKDILFRTPSNGGDSHLNNMAYIQDIFKFGGDFFPNAEILYYRDCFDITQKTDKDMKQKYESNEGFKQKILLSDQPSFEVKFEEDPKQIEKQPGGKIQNAKNHAERLINMGESGKAEFERLFGELGALLGFSK